MKQPKTQSGPPLNGGEPLTLHPGRQVGPRPIHVTLERFEDGGLWVKGRSGSLEEGDSILIEYRVDDDARYLARGEAGAQLPEGTFISCDGEWRRLQERSFVRISTHGLEVTVPRNPDEPAEGEVGPVETHFKMLDLSAGGMRFESQGPFEIGECFVCHFELPDKLCYGLPARVVRSERGPRSGLGYQIGAEFLDLAEAQRSELLQWIYQEQARRHHGMQLKSDL